MKIAVFHHLPDGGAKVALWDQVRRLKDRHTIDLFTFVDDGGEYDLKSFCRKVFLYPYETVKTRARGISRIWDDLRTFTLLRNVQRTIAGDIDAGGYDLAFVHHSRLTQAPDVLRFVHTPSVYFCQEPLRMVYEYDLRFAGEVSPIKRAYENLNRLIRKRIDLTNARAATAIVTSSRFAAEYIGLAYGVHPNVCPLGVESDVMRPLPGRKRTGFLFVGPPTPRKGYPLAREAIRMIPKNLQPKLKLISPSISGRFSLRRVQMVERYNSAVATVCVSCLEPFGLTALESMACQTPVVAVNQGGYRETVIDGETGFLIDPDPSRLAHRLTLLLKNPELGQRLGKAARKHVRKHWNWERGMTSLEAVFDRVVRSAGSLSRQSTQGAVHSTERP